MPPVQQTVRRGASRMYLTLASRALCASPCHQPWGNPTIGQSNVDLHKEEETAEWAALAKTGLGLFGLGDGAPNDALILRKLPPALGDRAESPTDSDLGRGAG